MTTNKTTDKEQMRRVQEYLGRVKRGDDHAPRYPLERVAVYKFVGGSPESGDRATLGYYRGRFVDVVATIVMRPEMGGWWLDPSAAGNPNAGYIVADAPPIPARVSRLGDLVGYLAETGNLERQKSALEKKIKHVDEQLR